MSNYAQTEHGPVAMWLRIYPTTKNLIEASREPTPADVLDAFRHAELHVQHCFVVHMHDSDARKSWNGADQLFAQRLGRIHCERMTRITETLGEQS